jgi:hypothetical protein
MIDSISLAKIRRIITGAIKDLRCQKCYSLETPCKSFYFLTSIRSFKMEEGD